MIYVALVLMFVAGFLVGLVVRPKDALSLDVNKDGKIDEKDLEAAKDDMKKVASKVQAIKSQVKKK